MAYGIKNKLTLHEGYFRVRLTRAINKEKSRFAYKIIEPKKEKELYKGEYKLDGVNVSEKTFTFKKI